MSVVRDENNHPTPNTYDIDNPPVQEHTSTVCINKFVPCDGGKRALLPTEFREEIATKLYRSEASNFIDKYRASYYKWKQSRISPKQVEFIRDLENRMANIYTPKQVEMAVVNGELVQITKSSSREQKSPLAYEPLDELALYQMSYETADNYINQMKSELEDTSLIRFGDIYDDRQQRFHDSVRSNKHSETEARIKEYTALQDLSFALESIIGHTNDDLRDLLKETILEGDEKQAESTRTALKEFMALSIDAKRPNGAILKDVGRLLVMCEESAIATDIANEISEEVMGILFPQAN